MIYGPSKLTLPLTDWLQRRGQEGSAMTFPAVPAGKARLRLFVTSEHTREQLERAASTLVESARHFGFLTQTSPQ